MDNSSRARMIAAATVVLVLVASHAGAAEPRLLRPGQYHGDEVTAVSGERWLALVRGPTGKDRLAWVTIKVDRVRDELADNDGPPTGKLVSAAVKGEIVVFLKDLKGLRPGPVTTLAIDASITPGEPMRLSSRGGRYSMALECGASELRHGSESAACSLVVRNGDRAQVLRTYEALFADGAFAAVGDDAQVKLLWAGDLDGDAAVDVLLDLTDHYNVSRPTLFLSRGRRAGTLLERVASHESVGC